MTDYLDFVEQLVKEGKTSGENQSEAMIQYTHLAYRRMKRWDKTASILPDLQDQIKAIDTPQNWIVLTEAWCGDAAHAFMFLEKMAELNPLISLEWKLRDEHLELMDQHLTNGGRAIPKLLVYNAENELLYSWGPRPEHIQKKYWELREAKVEYAEIMKEIQQMYNEDKGQTMQKEILSLMEKA